MIVIDHDDDDDNDDEKNGVSFLLHFDTDSPFPTTCYSQAVVATGREYVGPEWHACICMPKNLHSNLLLPASPPILLSSHLWYKCD